MRYMSTACRSAGEGQDNQLLLCKGTACERAAAALPGMQGPRGPIAVGRDDQVCKLVKEPFVSPGDKVCTLVAAVSPAAAILLA